jgi:hypothetical protein
MTRFGLGAGVRTRVLGVQYTLERELIPQGEMHIYQLADFSAETEEVVATGWKLAARQPLRKIL